MSDQYRAQFTTSQKAHEEEAEERADYFADNVRTVEGTAASTGRSRPITRSMERVKPEPLPVALSHRQKRQLKK